MTLPPRTSLDDAREEVADPGRLGARFAHPDKYPPLARAEVSAAASSAVAAQLAGVDVDTWSRHVGAFARDARLSARRLDGALAGRLPFAAGDRIIALGDSITDDLMSWAVQLQAYVDLHVPERELRVINAGITGNTTQEAIARIDLLVAARPSWVIQMLGTNDARLHGATRMRMQSLEETDRNLRLIATAIEAETGARLVRMTPPPVDARQADAWEGFRQQLITWRESDVADIAELVRRSPGIVVDLFAAFTAALPTDPGLMLPDGVHPSLAGQRFILDTLLRTLASSS